MTQRSVLDALEAAYPTLRGTIRDYEPAAPPVRALLCLRAGPVARVADAPLPDAVASGAEPLDGGQPVRKLTVIGKQDLPFAVQI